MADLAALKKRYAGTNETLSPSGGLDVEAYLNHYGTRVKNIKPHGTSTLWVLETCLFDPNHTGGEAAIGQTTDGKLFYQCFHDSCKGRTWKEARQIISGSDPLTLFMGESNSEQRNAAELELTVDRANKNNKRTEGQCVANRLRFLSGYELCAQPKPTVWLVKGILDAGALGCWFGESGSMKSFIAIDFGLCVATEKDWHGHAVGVSGSVFYIAGEGFNGAPRRIKAWGIHHDVDLKGIPFFVSDRPARFLEKESAHEVVQAVDDLAASNGKPALVIIDTLNRNFGPGDENSTADMTQFISAVDEYLRNRYGCAVLIIHHSGLSASERARGASALRAALDWEYRLQKHNDGTRTLTCTKAKDHAEPNQVVFSPKEITLDEWIDPEDGEVMTSCVLCRVEGQATDLRPLRGARKVVLDALWETGNGDRVHIDIWREAAYSS